MARVWLIFNGLDVLTTHLALRMGAVEANPIASGLNAAVGEAGGYGLKLFLAVVVALLVYRTGKVVLFKWLNLGMGVIVLFNFAVLAYCLAG